MIIRTILALLFNADNVNEPVRLQKEPIKTPVNVKVNDFIQRNFYLIALVVMLILLFIIIICCFVFIGSATDSGNYYYVMKEVI